MSQTSKQIYQQKIFVITGASDGLGKTLALHTAAQGATVVLVGKDPFKLAAVHDQILAINAPQPYIMPLDFRGANPEDYMQMGKLIAENFDRLDAVIHCAATLGHKSPLLHYDFAKWCEVLQVNLNSALLLAQALIPQLKSNPNSTNLIFTLSPEAIDPPAFSGAYAISKAALNNLAQILKQELESNSCIRVNTVTPVAMATKLRQQSFPAENADHLVDPAAMLFMFNQILNHNAA